MVKIAYVDTDQYQIDDNVVTLSKESTSSLLEHFNVSGSIGELLDNLKTSGTISLEEKNEIKEVEGSLGKESWEPEPKKFYVPNASDIVRAQNLLMEEQAADNANNEMIEYSPEIYTFLKVVPTNIVDEQLSIETISDTAWYFLIERHHVGERYNNVYDLYMIDTPSIGPGETIDCVEASVDPSKFGIDVHSSQKCSFKTTDENGVIRHYQIVKNNVIPVKNL